MPTMNAAQELNSNALLRMLPAEAWKMLAGRILTKPVNAGEVLCSFDAPLIYLVFPQSGAVSLQARLIDGRTVEEASLGRESALGIEYFLGQRVVNYHAVVTIAGQASWLAVSDFEAVAVRFPQIRDMIQYRLRVAIDRLRSMVVCASVHSASQRLASWLLRAQDSTGSNQFELTQRTLAGLFGLRLATISDTSSRLSAEGAIDQSRGTLTIIDRARLEQLACQCYHQGRERLSQD